MPWSAIPASLRIVVPLAICVLSGCAPANYSPRPLDREPLRAHQTRSPEDAGLAALVQASAYRGDWPPPSWSLETLTLVALYFNPRMAVVRAQAAVAETEVASAAQGLPIGLNIAAEHHSRQLDGDSPWSLGFSLELPLTGGGRRAARVDRASALAEAAQLDVAATAWRVRAELRDALIQHLDATRRVDTLAQRAAAQQSMLALVRKRVDAGLYSARELGQELAASAELETLLAAQRARAQDALSVLAGALGLPLDTVRGMRVGEDALIADAAFPEADFARELALKNRLEVQRRLLEFGASDAALRLALASRYPELSLSPGYLWDQGDRIWSLATGMLFAPDWRGLAGVREAEARRELAAQRFTALQIEVIAQTEQALAAWRASEEREQLATRQVELALQQHARTRRAFDAGVTGRLELVAAQLVELAARQAMQGADLERLQAMARLEDAIEKPLLGSYWRLPESAQARSGATR